MIFEVVNITSAITNEKQMLERKAMIVAFQEHAVEGKEAAEFKQQAFEANREMVLGPIDPELGRKTAGVGFSSQKGLLHMPIKAETKDYQDAIKTGRLLAHQWELLTAVLQVGNIYGWTGGVKGSKAADRTNDLLAIIANEFDMQEVGPKMIVGDLNGDLESLPIIQHLINDRGWVDLGSQEQLCGGTAEEPTCNVNAKCKESRRDFILVNDMLFDAAAGYRVSKEDLFPTHRPIQVSLDLAKLKVEKRTLRKPMSAADAFEEKVARICEEKKREATNTR